MSEDKESEAMRYNRQAYIKLDLGDLEGALEFFRRAVSLDSGNTSYRCSLIDILEKTGRLDEAVKNYTILIDQDPVNLEYYLGKARILEKLGMLNEALELYDKALLVGVDEPDIRFTRAKFFSAHEAYDRAIMEIKRSLEVDRENPEQMHFLCELYDHLDMTESAMECYDNLLSFYHCDPQIHYEKVRLLENAGRLDEASELMKKIIGMRPNSVKWLSLYAEFLESNDMGELALQTRKRIVEKEPGNWDHLRDLGELELSLGLEEEGRAHMDLAKRILNKKIEELRAKP